jgi:hypothetical protein
MHPRQLWSAPSIQRTNITGWADTQLLNSSVTMPTGCELESAEGLHWDRYFAAPSPGNMYGPFPAVNHSSHGYEITDFNPGTASLATEVYGWHFANAGLYFRVLYNVLEPNSLDCSVSGATMEPDW